MHFLGFFPRQCTVDLSVNVNFTKPVAPFIWPVKYIKLGQNIKHDIVHMYRKSHDLGYNS